MYGSTQDAFSTGTFYRCAGSRGRTPGPARPTTTAKLLDLDGGAGLFELGLHLIGLLAGDALLDRFRRLVGDRLGLLEAQPGELADHLDDRDLALAGAREDDVERRLLLLGPGAVATGCAGTGHHDRRGCGGRDAPALLERLLELDELEDRHLLQLLWCDCHLLLLSRPLPRPGAVRCTGRGRRGTPAAARPGRCRRPEAA